MMSHKSSVADDRLIAIQLLYVLKLSATYLHVDWQLKVLTYHR